MGPEVAFLYGSALAVLPFSLSSAVATWTGARPEREPTTRMIC